MPKVTTRNRNNIKIIGHLTAKSDHEDSILGAASTTDQQFSQMYDGDSNLASKRNDMQALTTTNRNSKQINFGNYYTTTNRENHARMIKGNFISSLDSNCVNQRPQGDWSQKRLASDGQVSNNQISQSVQFDLAHRGA